MMVKAIMNGAKKNPHNFGLKLVLKPALSLK